MRLKRFARSFFSLEAEVEEEAEQAEARTRERIRVFNDRSYIGQLILHSSVEREVRRPSNTV